MIPFLLQVVKSSPWKNILVHAYAGRTEEYAARTHERALDADANQYTSHTIVYAGHTGLRHETLNKT